MCFNDLVYFFSSLLMVVSVIFAAVNYFLGLVVIEDKHVLYYCLLASLWMSMTSARVLG